MQGDRSRDGSLIDTILSEKRGMRLAEACFQSARGTIGLARAGRRRMVMGCYPTMIGTVLEKNDAALDKRRSAQNVQQNLVSLLRLSWTSLRFAFR